MKELKELIELALMLKSANEGAPQTGTPLDGEQVVVRARNAGVHVGELIQTGDFIELRNSNRVWSWEGAFTLSQLSNDGITGGKIGMNVETLLIPREDVGEIMPLSETAKEKILKYVHIN